MKRPPFISTRFNPARSAVAGGFCLLALLAAGGCKNGAADPAGPTAATGAATSLPAANAPAAAGVTLNAVPDADRYKVTADTAAFFKYSPMQPAGSDLDLKKDTRVTMVRRGRGYSQIKTPDGQVGFVGTDDIASLTPNEIATENAASMQAAQAVAGGGSLSTPMTDGGVARVGPAGSRRSSAVEREYTIPPEAGNSERLPEPDPRPPTRAKPTPGPSPAPGFHY